MLKECTNVAAFSMPTNLGGAINTKEQLITQIITVLLSIMCFVATR